MRLVILESPYAPSDTHSTQEHIEYARACVKDSLARGEAPIASHLLYTQPGILNDLDPVQRALGISAGLAWRYVADHHVFYIDLGWSTGMKAALSAIMEDSIIYGRSIHEVRQIGWPK
jgi:hypothetical protein